MGLSIGAKLGPYEITALVGAGGMGEVYRARDHRLGRDVAIKVLPDSVKSDPERLRRFEQEARAAAALEHPNILAVHDFQVTGETPYLVAELLEGRSLREVVDRGPLELRRAFAYAVEIVRGLAAAHARGIVHRDLKPENLFVLTDDRVKILDFGLAKAITPPDARSGTMPAATETNAPHTATGAIAGSAGYMSPEQIAGKPVDHRADLFAFGAVLLELVSGRRAFDGATTVERAYATLHDEPKGLADLDRTAPTLARIVRRCVEKDPARRFQSTQDLLFQLEQLDVRALAGPVTNELPPVPSKRALSVPVLVAFALVLVAVSAALGWVAASPPRRLALLDALALERITERAVLDSRQQLEGLPIPRLEGQPATFQRATFRRGDHEPARFAPDGRSLVHTGYFDGERPRVYATQLGMLEGRALTEPGTTLLSVSSTGEMAILVWPEHRKEPPILARAPLAGGAPRQVVEGAIAADWSPDGRELAVLISEKGRDRIEYPLGKRLIEAPSGRLGTEIRVSPDGQHIAFFNYPVPKDDRGTVEVVDLQGRHRELSGPWYSLRGLTWSADGREVWFGASERGTHYKVRAVDLAGTDRIVLEQAGPVRPQDVAPDGRVLLTVDRRTSVAFVGKPGEGPAVRDVTWLDYTVPMGLSADGRWLVFNEIAESAVNESIAYVRDLASRSDPVRLGEGMAWAISPDGKYVLISPKAPYEKLVLVPTGPGQPRELPRGDVSIVTLVEFLPGGAELVIQGEDREGETRLWRQSLSGGEPEHLAGPGYRLALRDASPDGRTLLVFDLDFRQFELSLATGKLTPVRGLEGNWPIQWTPDGRGLFVRDSLRSQRSAKASTFDRATGRLEPWRELVAPDPVGAHGVQQILVSRDASTFVYQVAQKLGELYVAEGLR
ncbi:protein kinase [Myxococcota bacterium]|nr:protein kinase [Myxococcota bacterium]